MNLLVLSGRIVRDLELQTTQTGKEMVRNCIAVDGGKREDGTKIADFIDFVSYGGNAKFLSTYCHKGDLILIEASLKTGSYEKDGKNVKTTNVIVNRVEKMQGNQAPAEQQEQAPKPSNCQPKITQADIDVNDDDLPF